MIQNYTSGPGGSAAESGSDETSSTTRQHESRLSVFRMDTSLSKSQQFRLGMHVLAILVNMCKLGQVPGGGGLVSPSPNKSRDRELCRPAEVGRLASC